jgi:MFS transporter, YNFM family, putative membrane transport protein
MASIRIADAMLPALAAEFGDTPAAMAPVITLFSLAYGAMQVVWGPLGDRLGKLRVIGWAALAAMLGSIACALAGSLAALSLARLATGACCAAIIPLAIAHVGDTVDYTTRQATLARLSTGTLTGLIAGQVLGGFAADTLGWRSGFGLLAVVFLAAGVATLRLHARTALAPRPVPPGGASMALGLVRGWAAVFASPMGIPVLLTGLFEGALIFGALAFVPTWLHLRTGMALTAAGGAVAAVGLGGLAYSVSARRLIPLLGERGLTTLGGALIGLGYVGLVVFIGDQADALTWTVALIGCGVAGVGFYMLHNTIQVLATQLVPQSRATAVGLFAGSIFVGQAVGVAIAAPLGATIGHEWVLAGSGVLMAVLGAAIGTVLVRRRAS